MGLVRNPTQRDLLAVIDAAAAFGEPGFTPAEWAPSLEAGKDEFVVTGSWVPSAAVVAWARALERHHVLIDFEVMSPEWSAQMADYETEPVLLALEDLETVRKVLTTCVRTDRFVAGYLAAMFEAGVVKAAMKRLARLAETAD